MDKVLTLTDQDREYNMSHLKYHIDKAQGDVSEIAHQACFILHHLFAGLHHCDDVLSRVKPNNWTNPYYFECTIDGEIATFDFSMMTHMVVLAHEMCVRISVKSCGPRHLKLLFHPRAGRTGPMSQRHPTIEEAVENIRRSMGYGNS